MIVAKRFAAWFFSDRRNPHSAAGVIVWWELRRLPFNVIIGAYGIFCLLIFFAAIVTSGHLQPGEDAVEPLALLAAPFVINVLYSLGWIAELTARHSPHRFRKIRSIGPGNRARWSAAERLMNANGVFNASARSSRNA